MQFQDLSKRLITFTISLGILAVVFAFSYVEAIKWGIAFLGAAIGAVGIWEYCRFSKLTEKKGLMELCVTVGAIVILGFFISTLKVTFSALPFILLFIGTICIFLYHFDKVKGSINSIAKSLFGICYVAIPLGLILKILYILNPCWGADSGRIWLIYLLVVTKITDIGAYFGGRLIGHRKLAPQVSPGKTINGAIVGFLFAVLTSFLFHLISKLLPNFYLSLVDSLWLGALLGFLGQIGDLGESLLKRDGEVKDSNRLPGLGGILDMLDSLLFTTPVVYFFLYKYHG